jgi:hypothetical protein
VQGRMGRTAALRNGSQDEVPRRPICGTSPSLRLLRTSPSRPSGKIAVMEFSEIRVRRMATPGSTSLNVTFPGA